MKLNPSVQKRPNRIIVAGSLLALTAAALLLSSPGRRSHAQEPNRQMVQTGSANTNNSKRLALVIGNGAYTHAPSLKNPPSDATLVATTLKKLGFEVTVGTNKAQREMKQLIREFGQRLRSGGGVGLFYFAGHGVQARGKNFLIPIDAEIQTEADLEDAAVDVNYVLNLMDDAQNALNIAILDACRNNPFGRSFRSAQEGLAQVKAPTGTLIAYATAPDSVAADGGGANSPYAEELTRQMDTPGVVLETMFRRVTEQVSSRTGGRQEPWVSDNHKGEFYFSKGATISNPTSAGMSNTPATIDAVAVEREYWETIRSSSDAQDYKDYLQAYPSGAYAGVARAKIRQLETAKASAGGSTASPPSDKPRAGQPSNAPGEVSFSQQSHDHGFLKGVCQGTLHASSAGVWYKGETVTLKGKVHEFKFPCQAKHPPAFNKYGFELYDELGKKQEFFSDEANAGAVLAAIDRACGR